MHSGVVLEVDQKAAVNFSSKWDRSAKGCEVVGEAPLVDSGSATLGKVVENRRIQELPLNGRNALALAMFTPGVRTAVGSTYTGFTDRGVRISTMSINNSPGGMNEQLLDGNHNVLTYIDEVAVPPAVDAVEEFKVQSGAMSAEFGYTAGGVVNMVTKSGTNAFHGTAYEFLRNDKFDARNTFRRQQGPAPLQPVRRHRSAVRVKHDKTFFFFNYEAYRRYKARPRSRPCLPRPSARGDFSNTRDTTGAADSHLRSGDVRAPVPAARSRGSASRIT